VRSGIRTLDNRALNPEGTPDISGRGAARKDRCLQSLEVDTIHDGHTAKFSDVQIRMHNFLRRSILKQIASNLTAEFTCSGLHFMIEPSGC
jgi:hypothetical protein